MSLISSLRNRLENNTAETFLSYGTFVFNGLIGPVFFAPPPTRVALPHESDLEETGEVPAAAGQGRTGYDVIPEESR